MEKKKVHKVAVISDTHGILRPEVAEKLKGAERILHGGDITDKKTLDKLQQIAEVIPVRGNGDKEWAGEIPGEVLLELYGKRIYMVHNKKYLSENAQDADIIIYGHSHKYDETIREGKLWLNPGCCGPRRFNKPLTLAILEFTEPAGGPAQENDAQKKGDTLPAGGLAQVNDTREKGDTLPAGSPGQANDAREKGDTLPANGPAQMDAAREKRGALQAENVEVTVQKCVFSADGIWEMREGSRWDAKTKSWISPEAVQVDEPDAPGWQQEMDAGNLAEIVTQIVRDVKRGKSVDQIVKTHKINRELAEQICQIYFTHPGIDANGVLNKMEIAGR